MRRPESPAVELPTRQEIFGDEPGQPISDNLPRRFVYDGDRAIFEIPDLGIAFELDHVRRERHELLGQLLVRCAIAGARTYDGVLNVADFSLSSVRARQDRAKILTDRSHAKDVDWFGLVEEFVIRVLAAERQGDPSVNLPDVPKPGPEAVIDVDEFPLLLMHPIILFGDGGTLKSFFALYVAGELAARGVPVLYADWELTADSHRDRLERLFGSTMPNVRYASCARPLVTERDRLQHFIREHGIQYLVCDSIAYACHDAPEAADTAAAYFRAVRQLGVGSLHIAHCTKNVETNDRQPFGSVFWHNSARATWYAKRSDADVETPDLVSLALFNRKSNLGPRRPPLGFRFAFSPERVELRRSDLADVPDLAARLPIAQRVQSVLRMGSLPLPAIAAQLGEKPDSVEKAIRRRTDLFVRRERDGGKVIEFGLADRRHT